MDLVCGRQYKIGIVFKGTTARLTWDGIKLHSKPKSKKDFRGTAPCSGALEMHMCAHTQTLAAFCMCKDLSLPQSSQGQNSSL